ncbi:hypothetical protein EIP86_006068 [Pleurotus ostreatoroseus]|nr:hypothetical protein EIP86_006068 [Pleurotus ostreatoroseus]
MSPMRRWRRVVYGDVEEDSESTYREENATPLLAFGSVSARTDTLEEDMEKGELEQVVEGLYRGETTESHPSNVAAHPSNSRETTGTPDPDDSHPHSIPISPIPRVPPPAH